MKKIMTLMLGTTLLFGTVSMFAFDGTTTTKTTKTKKAKKTSTTKSTTSKM